MTRIAATLPRRSKRREGPTRDSRTAEKLGQGQTYSPDRDRLSIQFLRLSSLVHLSLGTHGYDIAPKKTSEGGTVDKLDLAPLRISLVVILHNLSSVCSAFTSEDE